MKRKESSHFQVEDIISNEFRKIWRTILQQRGENLRRLPRHPLKKLLSIPGTQAVSLLLLPSKKGEEAPRGVGASCVRRAL